FSCGGLVGRIEKGGRNTGRLAVQYMDIGRIVEVVLLDFGIGRGELLACPECFERAHRQTDLLRVLDIQDHGRRGTEALYLRLRQGNKAKLFALRSAEAAVDQLAYGEDPGRLQIEVPETLRRRRQGGIDIGDDIGAISMSGANEADVIGGAIAAGRLESFG